MTRRIDTRLLVQKHMDQTAAAIAAAGSPPCLACVLLCPAPEDSRRYRDLILKDAARLGARVMSLEPGSQDELADAVAGLNADPSVHGIMVFHPLGLTVPDEEVMDWVAPEKDVEGLHAVNLGYLVKYRIYLDEPRGIKCVVPATAKAVVKTLQSSPGVGIEGAFSVIVNNSLRVGKPLGLMLENLGATVVNCYDKTRAADLEAALRRADIVVTAVPDPAFRLDASWVRPGAAVIDVSYEGNWEAGAMEGRASLICPSGSNGIGRMTRAMTFVNLLYCAKRAAAGAGAAA